jgi:hypothetical protein
MPAQAAAQRKAMLLFASMMIMDAELCYWLCQVACGCLHTCMPPAARMSCKTGNTSRQLLKMLTLRQRCDAPYVCLLSLMLLLTVIRMILCLLAAADCCYIDQDGESPSTPHFIAACRGKAWPTETANLGAAP